MSEPLPITDEDLKDALKVDLDSTLASSGYSLAIKKLIRKRWEELNPSLVGQPSHNGMKIYLSCIHFN